MGAGAKSDPSRIQIADISETFEDSLARSTRQTLRKNGCNDKVPVVYSTEKPSSLGLVPLDDEKVEEADQYSALPTFRSRILPVLGTIPALFGNAMASHVLTELAGFKTEPLSYKANRKIFETLYKQLSQSEIKKHGDEYYKN
jgi:tRNA A37 threonylcarbamoyladenosine dehydratase